MGEQTPVSPLFFIEKKKKKMITDIMTKTIKVRVNDKSYTFEFDNKAYAELEMKTGKGIFQLYEGVLESSLSFSQYCELALCALIKHHNEEEISEFAKFLEENPYFIVKNLPSIASAFLIPLTPPEVIKKMNNNKVKKK